MLPDDQRLFHFFSDLRARCHAVDVAYSEFAPLLSPGFNTFDFIRPGEVQLSEIIAALLDPAHHHAQGDLFLRLFLGMLNLEHRLTSESSTQVKVACETATKLIPCSQRRIDIEINLGKFGIAIENKPWAADQANQLADYGKQLELKYGPGNWHLVYLTAYGKSPYAGSLSETDAEAWGKAGQFSLLGFESITQWLVKSEEKCRSEHVRHFLRDFIAYCQSEFFGAKTTMKSEAIRDYAMRAENLELTLLLEQTALEIKKDLYKQFIVNLRSALLKEFPGWEVKLPKNYSYGNTGWNPTVLFKPAWKKYGFGIEFEGHECQNLFWGIRKNSVEIPHIDGLLNKINEVHTPAGTQSSWWSWNCDFAPHYSWRNNPAPWAAIQDGTLVQALVAKMVLLRASAEAMIDRAEQEGAR